MLWIVKTLELFFLNEARLAIFINIEEWVAGLLTENQPKTLVLWFHVNEIGSVSSSFRKENS
jgi:hypothetical protein